MTKVTALIHVVTSIVREHGVTYLVHRLSRRIWDEIIHGEEHLFYFDCQSLSKETGDFSCTAEVKIERFRKKADIPSEGLNDLNQFVRKEYMKEEICRFYMDKLLDYFDDGGEITAGKIDGKIVGYVWKMRGDDNYHPYFHLLPLVPKDGFLIDGHVLPKYRGMGIFPTLLRYAGLLLKEEGAERAYGTCKGWNHSSRRGILKSGMRYLSTARSIGIFGKKIVVWSRRKGVDHWT